MSLNSLDPGIRRDDGKVMNQRFLMFLFLWFLTLCSLCPLWQKFVLFFFTPLRESFFLDGTNNG